MEQYEAGELVLHDGFSIPGIANSTSSMAFYDYFVPRDLNISGLIFVPPSQLDGDDSTDEVNVSITVISQKDYSQSATWSHTFNSSGVFAT